MGKFVDLTGKRFGRLVVSTRGEDYISPKGKKYVTWNCDCDCEGEVFSVTTSGLNSGNTKSCGCLIKDLNNQRCFVHGSLKVPEYSIWSGIKKRCYNPNSNAYKDYGGRGIQVCSRWLEPNGQGFLNFLADMGKRPSLKHSIDRKNNDSHYSCGHCEQCTNNDWTANCRWATDLEQGQNQRSNRLIEFDGQRFVAAEWARRLKVSPSAICYWRKKGFSDEQTLEILKQKHLK